jgi:uncharacterized cupredoxin-like copper-binding protein
MYTREVSTKSMLSTASTRLSRLRIVSICLLTAGIIACGTSNPSSQPSSAPSSPSWLTADAASKSVTLRLVASYNSDNAGMNFNGYDGGKMIVTVPQGWQVTVSCENKGATSHSCAIVSGAGDTSPAFPHAESAAPVQGFPPGQSGTFSFMADRVGSYRISCLVPGHDGAGMWDTFVVAPTGEPSVSYK